MEKFIKNFNEFREWLYLERTKVTGEKSEELEEIVNKFEVLGLNDVF